MSLFQSAPGAEAGGNRDSVVVDIEPGLFQSAPGAEAGGNIDQATEKWGASNVSIRPQRWVRVTTIIDNGVIKIIDGPRH